MSVKQLEDFICLIETAERVSHGSGSFDNSVRSKNERVGRAQQARGVSSCTSESSARSGRSVPAVPRLALASSASRSSPVNFHGPAASHCGLTLSSFSTPRPPDATPLSSYRQQADTEPSNSSRPGTGRGQPELTTVRRNSAASLHTDLMLNIQRGSPYVRRITDEVLPASPSSAHVPRMGGRSPASSRTPSSPSPVRSRPPLPQPTPASGQSQARQQAGSSPVRPVAPPPRPKSNSYSSSFSSVTSSPSKSPKRDTSSSDRSALSRRPSSEAAGSSGKTRSSPAASPESSRRSWIAASGSTRSGAGGSVLMSRRGSSAGRQSADVTPRDESSARPKNSGRRVTSSGSGRTTPSNSSAREGVARHEQLVVGAPDTPLNDRNEAGDRAAAKTVVIDEKGKEASKPDGLKKLRRKRPQSAPPKKTVESSDEPAPLGQYSKSLKLLGIEVPSARKEAVKLAHQEVTVTTKEPTIRTRLVAKSESHSDLVSALKNPHLKSSEFQAVRSVLKDAVFEEWYFHKYSEERERRRLKEEEQQKEEEEKLSKKKEVSEQSKEEFKKWMKKKNEAKKPSANVNGKEKKNENPYHFMDQETKLQKQKEWMECKMKEFKKRKDAALRKRTKEEEEAKLERDKKRTEAEKTFLAWKDDKTRLLKEERDKKKEELKEKVRSEEERRKEAESAFQGWKRQKEEVLQQRKTAVPADKKDELDENGNSKYEEARQAYEAWLDWVEKREAEEEVYREEQAKADMWKPPWYPGGKALL